jgi:hypothetical protein
MRSVVIRAIHHIFRWSTYANHYFHIALIDTNNDEDDNPGLFDLDDDNDEPPAKKAESKLISKQEKI